MAELVNEIISQEAQKQLDKTIQDLDFISEQIADLAKQGKDIQFSFKGAKDFAYADEVIRKATASVEQMEAANEKLTKTMLDAAKATKLEADANLQNAKASTEASKQKEIETRYTIALTKERERLDKAYQKEQANVKKLGNDYEILKKAQIEAANRAKVLGVTLGTNSAAFKEAASDAKRMHDVLLKVETAVGQSQRNVGNYAGSFMSVNQVLRETPSLANGVNTWLMAIGNNISGVQDDFKKLRAEFGSLKAAGMLLGSVFTASNIAILGFTALQFLVKWIGKASEETDKYVESLKNADEQGRKNAHTEQNQVETLLSIAKNTKIAMDVRVRAVKELQDSYPDYLGSISQEAILTGNVTKEVNALNDALFAKAMLQVQNEKIVANAKQFDDLTDKIKKQEQEVARLQKRNEDFFKGSRVRTPATDAVKFEQQQAEMKLKNLKYQLDLNKAQREGFELKRADYAQAAGELAVDKDKTKEKKAKDESLKAASEYSDSVYQLERQRLEREAANQKEIADSEENTLEERLAANLAYQSALLQLAEMEANKEIDVHTNKYNELEKKKKDASAKELTAIQIEQAAQRNFIAAAIEKEETAKNAIRIQGTKDTLSIIRSENEQWITEQKTALQTQEELQLQATLVEKQLWADALNKKLITRKEYDKQIAKINNEQRILILTAEIAFDDAMLKSKKLTAEEELAILRDKNKKIEELTNIKTKGTQASNPKGSFRITDALAKSLVPEGKATEEYLNEFYNRTVDLANQAADAIIQAGQREFDARMAMLDRESKAIESNKNDKIAALTAEGGKLDEINKLNAQAAAQQQEIEDAKKQAAIKAAQFQKAAAVAAIIQNTAVAIAAALKYGPLAPPIIALIAASGAIQLSNALAAPIPAYKMGTSNHKGGAFIAGDGGETEWIQPVGKQGYWSANTSTLYNEGAGTTVTPLHKFMQGNIANNYAFEQAAHTFGMANMTSAITDGLNEQTQMLLMGMRANKASDNTSAALLLEMKKQRKFGRV